MRPDEPAIEDLDLVANGIRFHAPRPARKTAPRRVPPRLPRARALVAPPAARARRGRLLRGRTRHAGLRGHRPVRPYDVGTLVRDVTGLVQASAASGRSSSATTGGAGPGGRGPSRGARRGLVAINCPPASALAHAMRHLRAQLRKSWYILFFQLPWFPERRMAADGAAVVARALVGGSAGETPGRPRSLTPTARRSRAPARRRRRSTGTARARPANRPRRSNGRSRRVAAPTLVLWGAEDRFLGRELVAPDVLRRVLTRATFRRWCSSRTPATSSRTRCPIA